MTLIHINKISSEKELPLLKEFNDLTAKIEKLKEQIRVKNLEMDKCLSLWVSEGLPEFKELTNYRFQFVQKLFHYYNTNQIKSNNDRETLIDMILMSIGLLKHYREITEPETLVEFENKVMASKGFEIEESSLDFAVEALENQLELLGVETELDIRELLRKGASMKDINAALGKEIQEKLNEQENLQSKKTPTSRKSKTKKVSMADMVSKNITELYRQLARIFHPDLEIDLEKKKIKEKLMIQLNLAYESKNLYGMLQLEINWFEKTQEQLLQLPEEKIRIFIHSLKEQIKILRNDLNHIPYQKKYSILQFIGSPKPIYSITSYRIIMKEFSIEVSQLKETVNMLNQPKGLKYLKEIIKGLSDSERYMWS